MELIHILVFASIALPFKWLLPKNFQPQGLLILTIIAVAWLMGDGGLESQDFLLLVVTFALTIAVWWLIQPDVARKTLMKNNQRALILIAVLLVVVYVAHVVTGNPPDLEVVLGFSLLLGAGGIGSAGLIMQSSDDETSANNILHSVALFLIVVIVFALVLLKFSPFANYIGHTLQWSSVALRTSSPLVWLGFSYIAFRLMGVLLDYRSGRLAKQDFGLGEFVTYVVFFPTFTAGPIDRAQRFIPELVKNKELDSARLVEGCTRIAIGVFKKFVIADSLALVAMNPDLIERLDGTWGLWAILYIYAFQIYFDFSGYSDVAIGIGRLYGLTLPENFNRPYLQPNIQQFWQRWHMTLSTWFRVYYFTPLSRFFIKSKINVPQNLFILFAQLTTMILIGLWHGITLNFLIWGIWHGVGLFIHKFISDNTKVWTKRVNSRPVTRRLMYVLSVFVTFHFVVLGWVFFAVPSTAESLDMLRGLFGIGG